MNRARTEGLDSSARARLAPEQPELAADSLLRIPLVRMMLEDPCVSFRTRAIDPRWTYKGVVGAGLSGFNPAPGTIFVSAGSCMAKWLEDPAQSARPINEDDRLVAEVFFAVHDYLHAWAYRVIREACPHLDFGARRATPSTLEDIVFCHLVTEAVATVGLDYWYLSTLDINDVVDLGTAHKTLTIPYHDRDLREYRRWCPSFSAQTEEFFTTVTDAYCSGKFPCFRGRDVLRSPMLLNWMKQELTYGRRQRSYARQWFAFLAGIPCGTTERELERPIVATKRWQRRLVRDVGKMLWAKVKEHQTHTFSRQSRVDEESYRDVSARAQLDFRFVNACHVDLEDPATLARTDHRSDSLSALLRQYVCMHEHDGSVDDGAVMRALETRDLSMVRAVLAHAPRVDVTDQAPRLLFLLS